MEKKFHKNSVTNYAIKENKKVILSGLENYTESVNNFNLHVFEPNHRL